MRQVRSTPVSGSFATTDSRSAVPTESRFETTISVALMTGIAFLPIVIAAGFLAEHLDAPSLPREVATAALRGPIDADRRTAVAAQLALHGSERPSVRVRAGF